MSWNFLIDFQLISRISLSLCNGTVWLINLSPFLFLCACTVFNLKFVVHFLILCYIITHVLNDVLHVLLPFLVTAALCTVISLLCNRLAETAHG